MTRLKIAFVVDRFGNRYGGAEAYGVALVRELSKWHDVTVFARDYDTSCDVQLTYVPLNSWKRWPSWIRVLIMAFRVRRMTRQGYDIVHSHCNGWAGHIEVVHVTPVRYNWRVRALPRVKRILSYVSLRVQSYLWLEARRVKPRQAHHVVAVSSLIARQLQDAYGPGLNMSVIPPGVYVPAADTPGQRLQTRTQLGFTEKDLVCILVARNPQRKGLKTILQALTQLPDHVQALVVGCDPATERLICAMPEFQNLEHRVKLVPVTSDVTPYYRAADICVHPTSNDSFGMAPLEAMSCGLPVIVSPEPWCGFAAYLKDGHDALLLKAPDDARHLAQSIARLEADPDLRLRLCQAAVNVVNSYAWSQIVLRYLELYNDVLNQDSPEVLADQQIPTS